MSDNRTQTTDCRLKSGHRYDADGRCQWCDAERGYAETVILDSVTAMHAKQDSIADTLGSPLLGKTVYAPQTTAASVLYIEPRVIVSPFALKQAID